MLCTIHGKHFDFCMGQAQSIQCAVMQYVTAVGCHIYPPLTNTCLLNPPFEPDVGYPVSSVTKKWFSCQQNQPFEEDVSYCLSWCLLSSPLLLKVRRQSPTLHCCVELCVDHQTVAEWLQFATRQCQTSF
jgi:hypothetical protein